MSFTPPGIGNVNIRLGTWRHGVLFGLRLRLLSQTHFSFVIFSRPESCQLWYVYGYATIDLRWLLCSAADTRRRAGVGVTTVALCVALATPPLARGEGAAQRQPQRRQ